MIGVCMTTIGLVKILEGRIGPSRVDEYLALNSIVFLTSAIFSYFSLRGHDKHMNGICEKIADSFFIGGLIVMAGIATLFAYEAI